MNIIFIDSSYFIFHRIYALHVWWKNAHRDEPLENPYENEIFREKFKSTFVSKIQEMQKKYKEHTIVVGQDCPRRNIWRMELYADYKGGRKTESYIGGFFSLVETENLYLKAGIIKFINHPRLEADDCIAIATKNILDNNTIANVIIITSDHDYLQLMVDDYKNKLQIMNASMKSLCESKTYCGNGTKELFMKIFLGDKSDNIPSVFKRCGKKTLENLYANENLIDEKLKRENGYTQYELNRRLIDFNYIPDLYRKQLLEHIISIIYIL
jgi:5'-3' exonuclease